MARNEHFIENDRCATHRSRDCLPDGFSVVPWAASSVLALEKGWSKLGSFSATPNPFCEPWFLIPSLEQFDPQGKVRLAVMMAGGEMVALMPMWHSRDYHGHAIPHLAGWSHANSFCSEPLIAPGHAERFWAALLEWCDSHHRMSAFLHFSKLPADGAAFGSLRDHCRRDGRSFAVVKSFGRAALRRGLSPDDHLTQVLGKKRRKELARKRRRLEEEGDLLFVRQSGEDGLDEWTDQFLGLENAGWKGAGGSSLAAASETRDFFRRTLAGAAREGKLERLAFFLDGRPIAMLCNFLAPPHAFSFKTAFDESLYKLSPGMLLQVENLAMLDRKDIAMTDSCAAPGHPMIEQIWSDRREIAMVSVGIGGKLRRRLGAVLTAIEARRAETPS